ncbi:hypothetical protein A3A39_03190 [Candidatus Kaiserbacteria bacterium RIFCSPLOWO2_01_FULL_54_13]|uniref:Uncharacterized protein n=1 Tax=Candidatus Kaiserbacteria bacterium RIFCSPLOWO2_01_FULL_54_13 TaxID=1798512 RepID=A0A1F6F466_9BACT|nr:MAG: hypothetical protein A3A39_03190 [Candidatus Kaiserbacteria bacterium RIFCSPLOWO2_01_FULL_54_13]
MKKKVFRKDKNVESLIETVDFIKDNMSTKDDVDEIKKTLNEHTRDLNTIKNDLKTDVDKRKQLEVRVTRLEQKV